MKKSEMNEHQKLAFEYVKNELSDVIGGWENWLEDSEEGSEDYEAAKKALSMPHDKLVNYMLDCVMYHIESDIKKGYANAGHAKFAGKDFIKERIERRLTKWGY